MIIWKFTVAAIALIVNFFALCLHDARPQVQLTAQNTQYSVQLCPWQKTQYLMSRVMLNHGTFCVAAQLSSTKLSRWI
jgi:hypothetical protein